MNLPMRLRSCLFVPAVKERAIAKAATLPADAVIFDLEDSVADSEKPAARQRIVDAASGSAYAGKLLVARVNGADTLQFADDLLALRDARLDAILLPKLESAASVIRAAELLARPDIAFWGMVETARGLVDLRTIAATSQGLLKALVVGPNDLVRTTGIEPGAGRANLLPWLLEVVLVAAAHGLHAIDGVYNRFDDVAGFAAECEQARALGFLGKTLIHPAQIDPANAAFRPGAAAIGWARGVVAGFAAAPASVNVIDVGGEMVERLHVDMARRILQDAGEN